MQIDVLAFKIHSGPYGGWEYVRDKTTEFNKLTRLFIVFHYDYINKRVLQNKIQ